MTAHTSREAYHYSELDSHVYILYSFELTKFFPFDFTYDFLNISVLHKKSCWKTGQIYYF